MKDVCRNLKSFETHLILSKLEGFWVDDEDNLMHAVASRITFICPMSFNSFPMDVQVCVFQVGSFNYATNKLLFRDEFIPVKEEAIRWDENISHFLIENNFIGFDLKSELYLF